MSLIGQAVLALTLLIFQASPASSASPARALEKPAAGPPYALTVIPFYSPEKLWTLYSPLVEYLKKKTGKPWELKLYHDHDALLEGLCKGEVSVALLGPIPLGRANKTCGVKPFLVALGKDGKPSYRSIIATNDPAATGLGILRGKKFGLFKGSTAAHIVPLKMLKDAGLGPNDIQPVFFEGQDRIMTALLMGEVAAAGMKEALFRKFEKEPIRALKTSDLLPNFSFCASPAASTDVVQQVTAALLALKPREQTGDARTVSSWDDEIKNGFAPPDADFLLSVIRLHGVYQEILHETR
jgi:ABC-type phosphate/phosphonate transport system substrate-binding protein